MSTDTNTEPDGLDAFSSFMNGDDTAPGEGSPAIEIPDFDKMKKGDLQKWVQEQVTTGGIAEDDGTPLITLKLKDLRTKLKAMFPAEGDLTAPDVTGFDPNDLIHQVVAEVQGLKTDQEAAEEIFILQNDAEFNFFKIGGVLAKIRAEGWLYQYETFGDLVEGEFSIKKRKAESLMQIYHALVSCGAAWDEAKEIGWSKLVVLAPCLTPENYQDWFATAKDSTQAGLVQIVKDAKVKGKHEGPEKGDESTKVSKKTFTLHEDQLENVDHAIGKAKEMFGTEHENVALDAMALDFLSGSDSPKASPPVTSEEAEATTEDEEEEVDAEENMTELFEAIRDEDSLTLEEKLQMIAGCFEEVFENIELEFTVEDGLDAVED